MKKEYLSQELIQKQKLSKELDDDLLTLEENFEKRNEELRNKIEGVKNELSINEKKLNEVNDKILTMQRQII